jgi:hypothetical protein
MTSHGLALTVSFALMNISCTSTQILQEAKLNHPYNADELIVILGETSATSEFNDAKIYGCLSKGMLDANPKLKLVKPDMFRSNLYPYFSTSTTPHNQEEYKALLSNSLVQQRIKALGIHYLITLTEYKTNTESHGGIFCGGGGAGAGCLGLAWWDRDTLLSAQIWDLGNANLEGTVQTNSAGTGILPAFILPIPVYMPATETASCHELGKQLAKTISSNIK